MSISYTINQQGGGHGTRYGVPSNLDSEEDRPRNRASSQRSEGEYKGYQAPRPSNGFDSLSQGERIEKATALMEELESTPLSLETGELARPSEEIIIEKTEDGFAIYDIV